MTRPHGPRTGRPRRAGGTGGRGHRVAIRRPVGAIALGHPEPLPLDAVVLTLDAARQTGCAVFIRGRLAGWSEVDSRDPAARRAVMFRAGVAAEIRSLPLVCAVETPWGGYLSAALSLTATVALWRDTWAALGRAPTHIREFAVGEWRRALFGRASLAREAARAWEARVASGIVLRDCPRLSDRTVGADAAAAICFGEVASRSSGIRKAVGCALVTRRRGDMQNATGET